MENRHGLIVNTEVFEANGTAERDAALVMLEQIPGTRQVTVRAIAEGSASWNLQGGMGLHLRSRGLQLSPYEESGDSSNVSRGRSVLAGPKMNPRDTSGCSQNPSPITKSLRLERI